MESLSLPAVPASRDDAPDPIVVDEVLRGDRARFAILVRRHNQRMFRAARAVLGDAAEAEDVVQHAWVSAFTSLAGFRGDAAFSTWVTRIAVHEALARRRRRARLSAVELGDVPTERAADPEQRAILGEIGQALGRHLDALPDGLRAVVVLRDLLELDTAETATCLGISAEAVRVRLHRARGALHRALGADGELWLHQAYRFAGAQCDRTVRDVLIAIGAADVR